ncbi:MAG: hypothetical protein B6I24_04140 [Bacteroidetes bacterium 4572_128]|nr:MAG: hypothetical protein B6I24_04140 [Bacteroidetes bacterium 4572_128]
MDKNGNFEGFDIVMGNPPYIQLRELSTGKYYDENNKFYEIAKGNRMNLFQLFMPLAFDIVKKNCFVSLIVQNSFLQEVTCNNIRKHIFDNYQIMQIDSFPERDNVHKRVFENAKVSVCIVSCKKIKKEEHNFNFKIWEERQLLNHSHIKYSKNEIINNYNYKIPLFNVNLKKIYNKILFSIKNKELINLDVFSGEINMTIHKKYFNKNKKNNLLIKGAQVLRYHISNKPSQGIVNYINLNQLKKKYNIKGRLEHHKNKRIVMQRITGVDSKIRLIMTYIDKNIFCANSVNYIIESPNYSLKYILAILNSKMFNFYFKMFSTNTNITISVDTSKLEKEIDILVYKLYNLTKEEIKIIENETI